MAKTNDDQNNRRRPGEDPVEWTIRTARLQQASNGYWYIHFTVHRPGETPAYRTGKASTGAKDKASAWTALKPWAEDMRDLARQGAAPAPPPMVTFREAADRYLSDTKSRRLTSTQDAVLRRVCRDLGDELLVTVDQSRIARFHAWAATGYAPGTVRQMLGVLKTVLRHAADCKLIPRELPLYQTPAMPRSRLYTLSAAEDTRVFDAAARWGARHDTDSARRLGLFVCLALDTAQRKEAILGLTWDRVNLDRATIDFVDPVYQPANKRRCGAVPVSRRLAPVLARAMLTAEKDFRGQARGPVFPLVWIEQELNTFRAAMGLPDFTPHVARHTWATLALARGVSIGTVCFVMADSIATIDRTYNHHTAEMAREQLEKFNQPALLPPNDNQGAPNHVMANG